MKLFYVLFVFTWTHGGIVFGQTTVPNESKVCGKRFRFLCNITDKDGFCPNATKATVMPPLKLSDSGEISNVPIIKGSRLLVPQTGSRCWNDPTGFQCCSNPCDVNPCWNGGTCMNGTGDKRFTCNCPEYVTGDICNTDSRCKNCSENADCVEGKCKCNFGFQGDGKVCTELCFAHNETGISDKCGIRELSFMQQLAGLSQDSNERCNDTGHRAVASMQCTSVADGRARFQTLKCVACTVTLADVNREVPKNITVAMVETNLEELEILTTGNKSVKEVEGTTNYLKSLADALDGTDANGTAKKISKESMESVLKVVDNLEKELGSRANTDFVTEPETSNLEPKVNETEDERKIRDSTREVTQLIDKFARKVDLDGQAKLEVMTKTMTLTILEPKEKDNGGFEDLTIEPASYSETQTDNDLESVTVLKKSVKVEIPQAAMDRLYTMATQSGESSLKLVVVLYQDASLLTVDRRTGQVIQATFKSGETRQQALIGEPFKIEYADPPIQTKAQEKAVENTLLDLHVEYFCVFWDFLNENWATEGCEFVVDGPKKYCECKHFTSFALLLRVTKVLKNYDVNSASAIYGSVACGLSAICLIITILIYLLVRELRVRRPTPIMVNICLNLALGYVMFIVGMDGRAKGFSDAGCYVAAIIMHITFLCSWFWMLIYSLNMYFALVKVVGTTPLVSKRVFMYVLGYAVPVVIVIVNLIVAIELDKRPKGIEDESFESHYIASHICWVRSYSMYIGFALPIGMILLTNIALFFIIIRKLTWNRKEIRSSKEAANVQQQIFMAITMITMMGLTWIFGYMMLFSEDPAYQQVMSTLFNVFNTSQGIVIFLVSCVRQKAVRKLWLGAILKRLCCSQSQHQKPKGAKSLSSESGIAVSSTGTTTLQKDTAL